MTTQTEIPTLDNPAPPIKDGDGLPNNTEGSTAFDKSRLTNIYGIASQQGLTGTETRSNNKAKNAVSSTSPSLETVEATKRVDKALFNAYLRRLEVLLNHADDSNASDILTQIIKLSMSYTVSIRSEKTYRLFVSSIILIIRNNFSSLEDPEKVSSFKNILSRFAKTQRSTKDYDTFMKASYMLGLSSLNKS